MFNGTIQVYRIHRSLFKAIETVPRLACDVTQKESHVIAKILNDLPILPHIHILIVLLTRYSQLKNTTNQVTLDGKKYPRFTFFYLLTIDHLRGRVTCLPVSIVSPYVD